MKYKIGDTCRVVETGITGRVVENKGNFILLDWSKDVWFRADELEKL